MANLPKLELKLNESAKLTLLRDKAYEGTNGFGPYYLYTVSHLGEEKSFFAPMEIHQQIMSQGLKKGSEFILHKRAAQNGNKLVGQLVLEAVEQEQPAAPQKRVEVEPTNGNGHDDSFKELMTRSLREAVDIMRSVEGLPFSDEGIQKIATSLFIARCRN
jgi:hypothetical protein